MRSFPWNLSCDSDQGCSETGGGVDYIELDTPHSLAQIPQFSLSYLATTHENKLIPSQGGNFHLKVGWAKSSGNAGDPMLGVAVIP